MQILIRLEFASCFGLANGHSGIKEQVANIMNEQKKYEGRLRVSFAVSHRSLHTKILHEIVHGRG